MFSLWSGSGSGLIVPKTEFGAPEFQTGFGGKGPAVALFSGRTVNSTRHLVVRHDTWLTTICVPKNAISCCAGPCFHLLLRNFIILRYYDIVLLLALAGLGLWSDSNTQNS